MKESKTVFKIYLKVILKGAATSEGDKDIRFHPQVTGEDALVDVIGAFLGLPGNRVDSLQDGDIIGLSIVKVDGEERNSIGGKLAVDPAEGWHLGGAGGKP